MIDTEKFIKTLNKKSLAIFGLGLSGFSCAKALIKSGANVYAWDEDDERQYFAKQAGIHVTDFLDQDFKDFDALILSPGVPLHFPEPHVVVQKARDAGIDIYGDVEIFYRSVEGVKSIGITGTNGKSTTTALIHHIMNECGVNNVMGGNIGKPVLDLDITPHKTLAVLELSSYQLDLCPTYRPDISILLNITPDHLDRHGDMDKYAGAKERIFDGDGVAICNIDDKPCFDIFERISKKNQRKIFSISTQKEISHGVFVKDGILFDAMYDEKHDRGVISDIPTLLGVHNQQNICAAFAACRVYGLDSDGIIKAIKTYKGLPYRQFLTRIINGVGYVNDSKATNADAAMKAIACYKNIYLIAGGRPKEGGLKGLEIYSDVIRHMFLIGEASDDFVKWGHKVGIECTPCQTLDVAVLAAHQMAQSKRGLPGGAATVLLSPACASWDQFKSFEHRGDVFTKLVESLSDDIS